MSIDAMKQMVAALDESLDLVEQDYATDWRRGLPTRKAQLDGKLAILNAHKDAIAAGQAAIEAAENGHD